MEKIQNTHNKKAVVESSHTYAFDRENHEVIVAEAEIANSIAKGLESSGYDTSKVVMLDETAPMTKYKYSMDQIHLGRFLAREFSLIQDKLPNKFSVIPESKYIDGAEESISELTQVILDQAYEQIRTNVAKDRIYVGPKKDRMQINLYQNINVNTDGVEKTVQIPSCDVLDMAAYKDKLEEAEIAITILPEIYKTQQERVEVLFKIIGAEPNIVNVYINSETFEATEVYSWKGDKELESLIKGFSKK
jgi:hypothetical protein